MGRTPLYHNPYLVDLLTYKVKLLSGLEDVKLKLSDNHFKIIAEEIRRKDLQREVNVQLSSNKNFTTQKSKIDFRGMDENSKYDWEKVKSIFRHTRNSPMPDRYFAKEDVLDRLCLYVGAENWRNFSHIHRLNAQQFEIKLDNSLNSASLRPKYKDKYDDLQNAILLQITENELDDDNLISTHYSSDNYLLDESPIFFGQNRKVSLSRCALSIIQNIKPFAIIGSGGIGKTNFAQRLINHHNVVKNFSNNKIIIHCEALSSVDLLCVTLLREFGVKWGGLYADISNEDAVFLHIQGLTERVLIVLDNFESLYENCIPTIGSFIKRLQRISSLIITMRTEYVPAEMDWDWYLLEPISTAEAADIFHYHSNEKFKEDPFVETLVEKLDLVPLAIELLAKRAKAFVDLYELNLAWEQNKIDFLTIRGYEDSKNHNVGLSISMSFLSRQISDYDRALLTVISQLPAPVEKYIIYDLDKKCFDSIDRLKAVGLLIDGRDGKFKVLSLIKEFVKMQGIECFWLLDRVVKSYIDVTDLHDLKNRNGTFSILEDNWDNVLFSLGQIKATKQGIVAIYSLVPFVKAKRLTSSYYELITQAAEISKLNGWEDLRAHCLLGQGLISDFEGNKKGAMRQFLDALMTASELETDGLSGRCFREISSILLLRGDIVDSRKCAKYSLEHSIYSANYYEEATTLCLLAKIEFFAGRFRFSRVYIQQAIRKSKNRHMTWHWEAIFLLSEFAFLDENEVTAKNLIEEGSRIADLTEDQRQQVIALRYKAIYELEFGDISEARRIAETAEQLSDKNGYLDVAADCSFTLGRIEYFDNDYRKATALVEKSYDAYKMIESWWGQAGCLSAMGDIYFDCRQYKHAAESYTMAADMFSEGKNPLLEAENLVLLGKVLVNGGFDNYVAEVSMKNALRIYTMLQLPSKIGETYASLSLLYFKQKRIQEARYFFKSAKQTWPEVDVKYLTRETEEFGIEVGVGDM